jgi:hypothetical protein
MGNVLTSKKLKKFQIVRIKWNDIISDNSGWMNNKQYDFNNHAESAKYESVGYYINKNNRFIFISMSANKENDISGMMLAIPIGTITEVDVLI